MESGGFSSPRADCFPAGLRVLVVDDDVTWLKILDKMLKKCNYEVTTCGLAREALDLLRGRKDGYDIVISDVNMPDMDGFKLLEHVGLEMDLPVIMMSVDGETSRVMKGVQHGACDYLLKPIRMKELRNIWQHVFRKRIHELRDIEGLDEIQMMTSGNEQSDDGYLFCGDLSSGKKRKDVDNTTEDRVCGDTSSVKKVRVVWTVDLHQKFVKAVNQIGLEKVGPKKILDLMGVPWLTRENVASHLQKYRLYLSRLQKENEFNAPFGAVEGIHVPICHQHSVSQIATTLQQHNILVNESHPVSRNDILLRNDETKIIEGIPLTKPKKPSSGSRINFDHHFIGPLDSNVKSISTVFGQYPWSADVQIQSLKSKQEHRPNFQTDHKFDHLTIHMYPKKVDSPQRGVAHNSSTSASQARSSTSLGKNKSQNVEEVAKDKNIPASFTVSPENRLTDIDVSGPIACPTRDTKNHGTEQNLFDDFESLQRNLFFGWDEKFNEFHRADEYFGNMEIFGYNNDETIADFPPHLYDPWKFNFEYVSDHMEYPVMDHGLFA